MATTNTVRFEARISPELRTLLKRAAEIQGRTMTDFVISVIQDAATRTIEQSNIIRLSLENQENFAKALIDPPEPNAAMNRAFERNKKLLKESQ
ncbi:DUF1778 domain-containing protein [Xenorhabdus ishibashii]|uniref:CopG family transcriptional regulator n=1 Tax=Xenorhabdus ishibashii TaxID=1034471 RepID=A0A2D0KHH2_9GAMM|nr:DUF1778 domain-containing protein [Xenorhabdus ishibashii]PHM62842.1 CopG family transcriptional regulator [Xenorhabdus ishibashii]